MENFYFPAFLVVVAAVVIWLFSRTRDTGSRKSSRKASRKARTSGSHWQDNQRLQRSLDRRGPASDHRPNRSLKQNDAMWRSRNQRAKHDPRSITHAPGSRTFHAGYLTSESIWDRDENRAGDIRNQSVAKTEYTGIDEYLTKRKAEQEAQAAREKEEFSMSAVKFESADKSASQDDEKKQAGFKP